jgi:hypothetical protein
LLFHFGDLGGQSLILGLNLFGLVAGGGHIGLSGGKGGLRFFHCRAVGQFGVCFGELRASQVKFGVNGLQAVEGRGAAHGGDYTIKSRIPICKTPNSKTGAI